MSTSPPSPDGSTHSLIALELERADDDSSDGDGLGGVPRGLAMKFGGDFAPDGACEGGDDDLSHTPFWNATLNNIMYIASPLAMPATLAAGGWFFGNVWFVYCAACTYWTGTIIGKVFNAHPALTTYPAMVGEALHARCYAATGDATAAREHRRRGKRAAKALQFTTFYLDTVTQIIFIAQYLGQLAPRAKVCQSTWLFIVWLMVIPVMQIPTFHASRWVIVPAVTVLFLVVASFFAEVSLVKAWDCEPGPSYGGVTAGSVFVSLSGMSYAFGGHGLFPETLREMKDPERWPTVMKLTYGAVVPTYFVVMTLGYYAYGSFVNANVNLNFPNNGINVFSLVMQLLQCYYLVFYTNVVLVMGLEMRLGIDPTATWTPAYAPPPLLPGFFPGGGLRISIAPVWARLALRTAFLASQMIVAELFIASGSEDVILAAQALTGAVGMAAMTFFLPSVLASHLLPSDAFGDRERKFIAVNFWIGIFIMATGVVTSSYDLLRDVGGKEACLLGFTYSPNDPGDPCYVSGIDGEGGRGEL